MRNFYCLDYTFGSWYMQLVHATVPVESNTFGIAYTDVLSFFPRT